MKDRLWERVHDAIERIVENELRGVQSWRIDLTNRLTDAAIEAGDKPKHDIETPDFVSDHKTEADREC